MNDDAAPPRGADVLVHGDDQPSWSARSRAQRSASRAVLLVAAVLAGVALLRHDAPEPRPPRASAETEVLSLSLDAVFERPGSGSGPNGLHVQLRNDGPAAVRLLSGRTAGGWRLEVDGATALAPGASTVLRLTPSPACSVLAEMRSSGQGLLVEAVPEGGRRSAVVVDLTAAGNGSHVLGGGWLHCPSGRPGAAALLTRR